MYYRCSCSYLETLLHLDCLLYLAAQVDLECLAHRGHLSEVYAEIVLQAQVNATCSIITTVPKDNDYMTNNNRV